MRRILLVAFILGFIGLMTVQASAAEAGHSRITDRADVLSSEEEQSLLATLDSVEGQEEFSTVVVTVPTLESRTIETVARADVEELASSRAGSAGLLYIIVAEQERQVFLQPTGTLKEVTSSNFFAEVAAAVIAPEFTEGDYAEGLEAGVISTAEEFSSQTAPVVGKEIPLTPLLWVAVGVAVVIGAGFSAYRFLGPAGRQRRKMQAESNATAMEKALAERQEFLSAKDREARFTAAEDYFTTYPHKAIKAKYLKPSLVEEAAQEILHASCKRMKNARTLPHSYYPAITLGSDESIFSAMEKARAKIVQALENYEEVQAAREAQAKLQKDEAKKLWAGLPRKVRKEFKEQAYNSYAQMSLTKKHGKPTTMTHEELLQLWKEIYPDAFASKTYGSSYGLPRGSSSRSNSSSRRSSTSSARRSSSSGYSSYGGSYFGGSSGSYDGGGSSGGFSGSDGGGGSSF